jgi:predicted DNA-binding transcriptional regulator AlpA
MKEQEKYLSEKEMAEMIKITDRSLKNRRCNGKNHPPFIKLGSTILYPESLAHQWLMNKVEHALR